MKNNTLLTLMMSLLLSLSVQAETLNVSLDKCSKIQDSSARLVCFDAIAKKAKTTSASVITKPVVTVTTPAETKVANFGGQHLKKSNVAEDDQQVVFSVAKLYKDPYDKWRFTFENGQQWKQMDSTFFKVKVGDSVLLKKGFMDAVYLKQNKPDSNKKIRVKRLK